MRWAVTRKSRRIFIHEVERQLQPRNPRAFHTSATAHVADWFFFFSAFSVNFRSSLKGLFTFLFSHTNQILSGFKSIKTVSRSRLPKEFYQVRGVWGRRVKGRRKKGNEKAKNSIFSRSGLCGCFVLAPSFKEWGGVALFYNLDVAIIDPFPSWRCTQHSYM